MKEKKTALVTGASSGMGKDFVEALLKEGYLVYGVARRVEKMKDIKEAGAITLKMDITKDEEIKEVVSTIEKKHGSLDVLINNAGYGLYGSIEEVMIKDARYQFEVNLFGLARLTQLLLPGMRHKESGKIINISSIGAKIYGPLGAWYYGTKHALEGWSNCLRVEVKQFGIKVVIIEPGLIATGFGDVMMDSVMNISGKGHYKHLAEKVAESFEKLGKIGSHPKVITNLVIKAVRSKNPKIRYRGGKFAKSFLFLRRHLSDRLFDKLISMSN